jgi:hypothetical protein
MMFDTTPPASTISLHTQRIGQRRAQPGESWRRRALGALVVGLVVAVLGASQAPAWAHAPVGEQAPSPSIAVSFGPEATWNPEQEAIRGLHGCQYQAFTCVQQVMQQHGATPDAIAFYRLTAWFLSGLQDTGRVQLGTILNPWRANENSQPALLGGIPAIVYPEQEATRLNLEGELEHNADYTALKATHPDAMFWPSSPSFEGLDTSPQGGQRFVFRYRVLAGCHACATLAEVRVGFDFTPDGTYQSFRLLNLVTR